MPTREADKPWQRGYNAKRYASRRTLVDQIKLASGCVDCGYRENPVALDFDHRDPGNKHRAVGKLLMGDMNVLLAEIDKCDVRCSNCHRIRTHTLKHYKGKEGVDL